MITVLKSTATKEQRDHLISWLESQNVQVHISEGTEYTVLGLVGDTAHIDVELLESLDIVDSVKRVSEAFKKVNRKFHPADSIVDAGGVPVGGRDNFAVNKVRYYIMIAEEQSLSIRQLRERIKSKEYERLPEETRNKLISKRQQSAIDFIKNPILIKDNSKRETFSEKVLQRLILEDIPSFLRELGNGFTFIDNEYKIRLGSNYNYIDLLLFNYELNAFVVVELKVCELRKEHIGQIEVYMNYIDQNLKNINHNKTIGIIICKEDNKYVIKYCSDKRIISRVYELV